MLTKNLCFSDLCADLSTRFCHAHMYNQACVKAFNPMSAIILRFDSMELWWRHQMETSSQKGLILNSLRKKLKTWLFQAVLYHDTFRTSYKQVTFVTSTHFTLDCKRQRYLSHVLLQKNFRYPFYLNKQYKSLCFSRGIRKNNSTLVYTSNAHLSIHTGPFSEKCFFTNDSNDKHIFINYHEHAIRDSVFYIFHETSLKLIF